MGDNDLPGFAAVGGGGQLGVAPSPGGGAWVDPDETSPAPRGPKEQCGGDGTPESPSPRVRSPSASPGHRTGEDLPAGLGDGPWVVPGALDSTPAMRREGGAAPQTTPPQTARTFAAQERDRRSPNLRRLIIFKKSEP